MCCCEVIRRSLEHQCRKVCGSLPLRLFVYLFEIVSSSPELVWIIKLRSKVFDQNRGVFGKMDTFEIGADFV